MLFSALFVVHPHIPSRFFFLTKKRLKAKNSSQSSNMLKWTYWKKRCWRSCCCSMYRKLSSKKWHLSFFLFCWCFALIYKFSVWSRSRCSIILINSWSWFGAVLTATLFAYCFDIPRLYSNFHKQLPNSLHSPSFKKGSWITQHALANIT